MHFFVRFGLLLYLATPALADQVFLSNGDRISGKIQMEVENINVTSPAVGELKVPRSVVVKIVMEKPTPLMVGGEILEATSVTFDAHSAAVEVDRGRIVNAPGSTIMSAPLSTHVPSSAFAELLRPWNFSFDAGFTAARGNTALNNLNFGFKTVETSDTHRLNLAITSLLAQSGVVGRQITTANNIRSSARYEFNVSDRVFGFSLATFDSDQLQHLDLRSVFGGGVGFRLVENKGAKLDVFSGGTFDQESFSDHRDRNSGELLAGEEMSYKFSNRTSVTGRLVVFPSFTTPGQYRVNFDSSVFMKLNKWLGWQSSLTDMYLTNPVAGSRNNDLLVTTGLRITFGRERAFKPRSKIAPLSN